MNQARWIDCPQCKKLFRQDEPWKRVCLGCFLSSKNVNRATPKEPPKQSNLYINKQLLPKLIMLCHPDKHNGSKMSVEVTQQLLELRNK
jgi:hypothetical protein